MRRDYKIDTENKIAILKKVIKIMKDVPAEDFVMGMSTNGKNQCCFLGHYNRLTSNNVNDYGIDNCFPNTKSDLETVIAPGRIMMANDDELAFSDPIRKEKNPKARVLKLLKNEIKNLKAA